MLARAASRSGHLPGLVRGRAERLPFADASFDHVTFTYLLRYVDDPAATLRELARVLRPGGRLAALEFGIPRGPLYPFWLLHTRVGLPLLGRLFSARWSAVGGCPGPSIDRFYRDHPESEIEGYWRDAGLVDVTSRRVSVGGAIVMSGIKAAGATETLSSRRYPHARSRGDPSAARGPSVAPATQRMGSAFYALRPGGWRDYWTLLHPPYTAWHLSYVLLGAALAPAPDPRIVLGALLAFGLAVGVAAHSFDELQGRPLGTRIPARVLVALGALGLAGAAALGIAAVAMLGPTFGLFVAAGIALVLLYAFEAPLVHSDLGFALAWGAFPVLTAAYATGAPPLPAVAVAAAAALFSLAQRVLSTRVRAVRRRSASVEGEVRYRDGSRQTLDAERLIAAPESSTDSFGHLSSRVPICSGVASTPAWAHSTVASGMYARSSATARASACGCRNSFSRSASARSARTVGRPI